MLHPNTLVDQVYIIESATCRRRVQQTMEAVRWQLVVSFHDSEVKERVSRVM